MAQPKQPKKTVAVLEDDSQIRSILEMTLGQAGYDCHLAASPYELINFVVNHRPDAYIIDLGLPVMDGDKAMQLFQQKGLATGIPVIIISSKSPEEVARAAAWVKAVKTFPKPFDPRLLLNYLDSLFAPPEESAQN